MDHPEENKRCKTLRNFCVLIYYFRTLEMKMKMNRGWVHKLLTDMRFLLLFHDEPLIHNVSDIACVVHESKYRCQLYV